MTSELVGEAHYGTSCVWKTPVHEPGGTSAPAKGRQEESPSACGGALHSSGCRPVLDRGADRHLPLRKKPRSVAITTSTMIRESCPRPGSFRRGCSRDESTVCDGLSAFACLEIGGSSEWEGNQSNVCLVLGMLGNLLGSPMERHDGQMPPSLEKSDTRNNWTLQDSLSSPAFAVDLVGSAATKPGMRAMPVIPFEKD